jgi:hypothetical protein
MWHFRRVSGDPPHEVVYEGDTDNRQHAEHLKRQGAEITPDDLGDLGPYRRPLGSYTLERLGQSFGGIITVAQAYRRGKR